jgi:hypothetical protein
MTSWLILGLPIRYLLIRAKRSKLRSCPISPHHMEAHYSQLLCRFLSNRNHASPGTSTVVSDRLHQSPSRSRVDVPRFTEEASRLVNCAAAETIEVSTFLVYHILCGSTHLPCVHNNYMGYRQRPGSNRQVMCSKYGGCTAYGKCYHLPLCGLAFACRIWRFNNDPSLTADYCVWVPSLPLAVSLLLTPHMQDFIPPVPENRRGRLVV